MLVSEKNIKDFLNEAIEIQKKIRAIQDEDLPGKVINKKRIERKKILCFEIKTLLICLDHFCAKIQKFDSGNLYQDYLKTIYTIGKKVFWQLHFLILCLAKEYDHYFQIAHRKNQERQATEFVELAYYYVKEVEEVVKNYSSLFAIEPEALEKKEEENRLLIERISKNYQNFSVMALKKIKEEKIKSREDYEKSWPSILASVSDVDENKRRNKKKKLKNKIQFFDLNMEKNETIKTNRLLSAEEQELIQQVGNKAEPSLIINDIAAIPDRIKKYLQEEVDNFSKVALKRRLSVSSFFSPLEECVRKCNRHIGMFGNWETKIHATTNS